MTMNVSDDDNSSIHLVDPSDASRTPRRPSFSLASLVEEENNEKSSSPHVRNNNSSLASFLMSKSLTDAFNFEFDVPMEGNTSKQEGSEVPQQVTVRRRNSCDSGSYPRQVARTNSILDADSSFASMIIKGGIRDSISIMGNKRLGQFSEWCEDNLIANNGDAGAGARRSSNCSMLSSSTRGYLDSARRGSMDNASCTSLFVRGGIRDSITLGQPRLETHREVSRESVFSEQLPSRRVSIEPDAIVRSQRRVSTLSMGGSSNDQDTASRSQRRISALSMGGSSTDPDTISRGQRRVSALSMGGASDTSELARGGIVDSVILQKQRVESSYHGGGVPTKDSPYPAGQSSTIHIPSSMSFLSDEGSLFSSSLMSRDAVFNSLTLGPPDDIDDNDDDASQTHSNQDSNNEDEPLSELPRIFHGRRRSCQRRGHPPPPPPPSATEEVGNEKTFYA